MQAVTFTPIARNANRTAPRRAAPHRATPPGEAVARAHIAQGRALLAQKGTAAPAFDRRGGFMSPEEVVAAHQRMRDEARAHKEAAPKIPTANAAALRPALKAPVLPATHTANNVPATSAEALQRATIPTPTVQAAPHTVAAHDSPRVASPATPGSAPLAAPLEASQPPTIAVQTGEQDHAIHRARALLKKALGGQEPSPPNDDSHSKQPLPQSTSAPEQSAPSPQTTQARREQRRRDILRRLLNEFAARAVPDGTPICAPAEERRATVRVRLDVRDFVRLKVAAARAGADEHELLLKALHAYLDAQGIRRMPESDAR